MPRALLAGSLYFLAVFAAGFVLGTVRVLVLVPRLGELAAVLLELPLMLGISWAVAGWLLRAFAVPRRLPVRLGMGGLALGLLLLAEAGLAVLVFGESLSDYLSRTAMVPGLAGLAGQVGFGLMPALRR